MLLRGDFDAERVPWSGHLLGGRLQLDLAPDWSEVLAPVIARCRESFEPCFCWSECCDVVGSC